MNGGSRWISIYFIWEGAIEIHVNCEDMLYLHNFPSYILMFYQSMISGCTILPQKWVDFVFSVFVSYRQKKGRKGFSLDKTMIVNLSAFTPDNYIEITLPRIVLPREVLYLLNLHFVQLR